MVVGSSGLELLLNDGSGGLGTAHLYPLAGAGGVALADVNFDGRLDVVVVGAGITVFLGNGEGALWPQPTMLPSSGPYHDVALADFSGDGRLDLALRIRLTPSKKASIGARARRPGPRRPSSHTTRGS